MLKGFFAGIDTSNYTTSMALCTEEGEIIANLKAPLPVDAGECGLRQSDAVFTHIKNLPRLTQEFGEVLKRYGGKLLAVGCSQTPRDEEGSYMPCFLSGVSAATAMATGADVPLYRFSHQNGHIMAAAYSSGRLEKLLQAPFGAFHVSGGTTEMLLVTPNATGFDVALMGETLDLNAGQAIDRVGVMMGLKFPCGREMECLADAYTGKIPKPKISVMDGSCNLSGLQNLAEKLWNENHNAGAVSAFVFDFIGRTLVAMTKALDTKDPELPVLYAGGVMSNRRIQSMLSSRKNTYFAEPQYSADNAAGIALLCRKSYYNDQNR